MKIIELQQNKDGVFCPSNIEESIEENSATPMDQLLDGMEKGMKAINRFVSIIEDFNANRQKK